MVRMRWVVVLFNIKSRWWECVCGVSVWTMVIELGGR